MTEKLNPIERALVAAAAMPAPKSRAILRLICESGMTLNVPHGTNEPTEGQKHYAKREKFIKRTKGACDRVLKYAKHETLRNIEKHFRETPIKSGDVPGHEFHGNQWTGGTYYHGTGKEFTEFDSPKEGKGIWLTSDKSEAERYAGITTRYTGEKARVIEAHLSGSIKDGTDRVKQLSHLSSSEMMKRLKAEGYDAFRDGDAVVVLNPKLLKIFRETPPITSAANVPDSEPTGTLAARLTFKRPDFTTELLAALREEAALALQVAGQQLFDEIGSDNVWTMPGSVATDFLDARANLMANVPDEVHAEIMQAIQDGLDHGESRRELMARIGSKFDEISKGRAETIANTETSAAFNFARDKAMREAGVTHKRWLHSQSPDIKEPRPTHVEADGQTVPIDKPFDVGGVKFMMPADDSLGAGPEDIINCHCVSIPVEKP